MEKYENIADMEHERWLNFTNSFGNNGFFEEGIILAVEKMEALCEIIFGDENASAGFTCMVGAALKDHTEGQSWSEILEEQESSIFSETQGGQLLHDLTAYADFGIVLATSRDLTQREQLLKRQIQKAERLIEMLPVEHWKLSDDYLVKLIRKASARWKIDTDQSITARELAMLSGKALQTIRNKVSGQYREINGTEKHIEAREAKAWLASQRDFLKSIWREQNDDEAVLTLDQGLEKVLFLPVAKDGSVFHPGITRDGKFMIDEDGRERELDSFDEALEALQLMRFPQWRRPTAEGVWTRVRAVEWRRYDKEEMTRLILIDLANHAQTHSQNS